MVDSPLRRRVSLPPNRWVSGAKCGENSDERWNRMKSWQSCLLFILIRSRLTQQWRWICADEHSSAWRSTHRTNPKYRARHRRMSNIGRREVINEELNRWKEDLFVNEENRRLCQRLFNQWNVNRMERSLKLQLTFDRGQCLSIIDGDNPMESESMQMAQGEISSLHLFSISNEFPPLQLSGKDEASNHLNRDQFWSIQCDLLHSMINRFVPIHPDQMFGKILSPRNSFVNRIFVWIFLVRRNNFALTETFPLILPITDRCNESSVEYCFLPFLWLANLSLIIFDTLKKISMSSIIVDQSNVLSLETRLICWILFLVNQSIEGIQRKNFLSGRRNGFATNSRPSKASKWSRDEAKELSVLSVKSSSFNRWQIEWRRSARRRGHLSNIIGIYCWAVLWPFFSREKGDPFLPVESGRSLSSSMEEILSNERTDGVKCKGGFFSSWGLKSGRWCSLIFEGIPRWQKFVIGCITMAKTSAPHFRWGQFDAAWWWSPGKNSLWFARWFEKRDLWIKNVFQSFFILRMNGFDCWKDPSNDG